MSDKKRNDKRDPSKKGSPKRGAAAANKPAKSKSADRKTASKSSKPERKGPKKGEAEEKGSYYSGWKTEQGSDASRSGKPRQYREVPGKSWRGKPVVEVKTSIRLNKYIANSGICSRREADKLIEQGLVEVNGKVVTEMGHQVKEGDKVSYAGETIRPERPTYVLLNKPKDTITTMKDPQGRNTVMSLLRRVGDVRIYPVGRLDRNTTGLLLLTNDGNLAKKLTHPTHGVSKLYHVHTDKAVKTAHLKQLLDGVELEDGPMKVDEASHVAGVKDKKQVGVRIHSGRNRIVRRLFEHLGYKVLKLDRVMFADLSKKDLPRGRWRFLTEQEVNRLKML